AGGGASKGKANLAAEGVEGQVGLLNIIKRAAEFPARAVVTESAEDIQFREKLVAVIFQLNACFLDIEFCLQKVWPLRQTFAPTVLHAQQLPLGGKFAGGLQYCFCPFGIVVSDELFNDALLSAQFGAGSEDCRPGRGRL